MVELFKSPVKRIYKQNDVNIIEFQNGITVPLYGAEIPLNYDIPKCNFCGNPAIGDEPLYSPDDKTFICKDCAILAIETFANNGFEVNLKVKGFNKAADDLQKMGEKVPNKND
jgi:hypothetical protein